MYRRAECYPYAGFFYIIFLTIRVRQGKTVGRALASTSTGYSSSHVCKRVIIVGFFNLGSDIMYFVHIALQDLRFREGANTLHYSAMQKKS